MNLIEIISQADEKDTLHHVREIYKNCKELSDENKERLYTKLFKLSNNYLEYAKQNMPSTEHDKNLIYDLIEFLNLMTMLPHKDKFLKIGTKLRGKCNRLILDTSSVIGVHPYKLYLTNKEIKQVIDQRSDQYDYVLIPNKP